jgi:uncharacterized protein (UPF0210 family)
MKVRAITIGITVVASDFQCDGQGEGQGQAPIVALIRAAVANLQAAAAVLRGKEYEVQTVRICLNSFEEWNPTLDMAVFEHLFRVLDEFDVKLCAIGNCSSHAAIALIPELLAKCDRISASVQLQRKSEFDCAPDYQTCLVAAETCLGVAKTCGDHGNFRYCIGFNCPAGIPFFPTAFHDTKKPNNSITIGLENADLLFLAFYGAGTLQKGTENLVVTFKQVLAPIHDLMEAHCAENGLHFNGIDASINPGLNLPESVGFGMEHILGLIEPGKKFGTFGTLSAVAAVTSAFKQLKKEGTYKLAGYCGLMLPVMEDLILAERSAETSPELYTLRDLLTFSSVCGVGLDTVPIAGDAQASDIASVYLETGTLAYRLDKPLTARLLPIAGKTAGAMSEVNHPSLVNSKIFSVKI